MLLVSGQGLSRLTTDAFNEFFQVTETNPIVGAESRVGLLNRLGASLLSFPDIFGTAGRPGSLVGTYESGSRWNPGSSLLEETDGGC